MFIHKHMDIHGMYRILFDFYNRLPTLQKHHQHRIKENKYILHVASQQFTNILQNNMNDLTWGF